MIQVPAYLNACLTAENNTLVSLGKLFDDDSDSTNNGGYNLFQVFVENLFGIYQNFINTGMMSKELFEKIKKEEYRNWLSNYVTDTIIFKTSLRKNFKMENSIAILRKHYGKYPYVYFFTIKNIVYKIAILIIRLFSFRKKGTK